jgi:hypothetical protein
MKKNLKWLLLSGVLLFYAALYLATEKKCDDECQKLKRVGTKLNNDPSVYNNYQCGTDMLCVHVNDSISRNWGTLADTACQYLKNEGLQHYNVYIVARTNQDTLAKQTCP